MWGKRLVYFLFLLLPLCLRVCVNAEISTEPKAGNHYNSCALKSPNISLYCRCMRALRNMLHNLNKSDKPIIILPGLEIVPVQQPQVLSKMTDDTEGQQDAGSGETEDSLIERFSAYLRTHELNIKFSQLLDEHESGQAASSQHPQISTANEVEERKKDKGQGLLLAMSVMFAKMMAMLGIGGIGVLALKALGVASAALMMAGLLGLKSLAQHGQESSHSVQYVTADGHHHRRRRSYENPLSIVYQGWQQNTKSMT